MKEQDTIPPLSAFSSRIPIWVLSICYMAGGTDEELDIIAELVDALMAGASGLAGGCSRLAGPGALVRWLADSPEALRKTHFEIWKVARRVFFGREATPLRKF